MLSPEKIQKIKAFLADKAATENEKLICQKLLDENAGDKAEIFTADGTYVVPKHGRAAVTVINIDGLGSFTIAGDFTMENMIFTVGGGGGSGGGGPLFKKGGVESGDRFKVSDSLRTAWRAWKSRLDEERKK